MIGAGDSESRAFAFELVYNYGIGKYDRGNDIRYIGMSSLSYVGPKDAVSVDAQGNRFLQTPDGHYILLIDKENSFSSSEGPVLYISLHVSHLESAKSFYRDVLGAKVVSETSTSVSLLWPLHEGDNSRSSVGVELVQLPQGLTLDHAEAQGRFAIETEDNAPDAMSKRVTSAGLGKVMHGPIKLEVTVVLYYIHLFHILLFASRATMCLRVNTRCYFGEFSVTHSFVYVNEPPFMHH
jgi:catechol 2,3-dioxygenase-like lactoylglutathione lyase family enzyme